MILLWFLAVCAVGLVGAWLLLRYTGRPQERQDDR